MPSISVPEVKHVLMVMAGGKARGCDAWDARAWRHLDDTHLQRSADILNHFESHLRMPSQWVTTMALIPKPRGGERP
eukprot:6459088-Amphidinium_carterae.1